MVPSTHVAFSSKPSRNQLCSTILEIILTSYAYVLSLRNARSPPPHDLSWCARPRDRSSRSLNILTAREPMGLSSRRQWILLASHRMALTRERKNRAESLEKSRFSQFLLGWSPRWFRRITRGLKFLLIEKPWRLLTVDYDDRLSFMKHLV